MNDEQRDTPTMRAMLAESRGSVSNMARETPVLTPMQAYVLRALAVGHYKSAWIRSSGEQSATPEALKLFWEFDGYGYSRLTRAGLDALEAFDLEQIQRVQRELPIVKRPTVKVKRMHPDAVLPRYQTSGAAAFDLSAVGCEPLPYPFPEISSDGFVGFMYATGLAFEIPPGHVGLVMIRSSLAKQGYQLLNGSGVIDSDYRGEVFCPVGGTNGGRGLLGHRIAQMLILPVAQAHLVEASELSQTARGDGGFGSTGTK